MRGKYVKIDKDLLLETYEKCGRSLNQTGKTLGISPKTIKRRFVEYGLEYDPKIEYSCNENFFDELNEKSMYWLGFLSADGNVYKHVCSYTISLGLATKDIEHLRSLKEHINFTGVIHSYITKNNGKQLAMKKLEYYRSTICLTSQRIFDRLADFNIVPAKTHILEFPAQLKDHPLINNFIRGCIDGDGWIREHCNNGSKTPTEIRIGMCGTEKFVRETFQVIKEKLNIKGGYCAKDGDTNSWSLEFSGLHDVDRLVDWLYKDATIFLDRKYKIAQKAKAFAARYVPFVISKEQLERDYLAKGSIRQLADQYGVDPMTVKNRLVNFDIEHRTIQAGEYDHFFFSDKNAIEAQYYWAGFLAGKSTYLVKNDKPYLAFNCNDESVIKSFLRDTQMRLHIIQLKKKDQTITYQINIFDDVVIEQLRKFGIDEYKQTGYVIPEWLLEHPFLYHFLRGYLDARSSLLLYEGKLSLNIKNSHQFLHQIGIIFEKNCSAQLTAKIKDTGKGNFQIIYLTKQAQAILDWLYQNATIYLPRKLEIAMMSKC